MSKIQGQGPIQAQSPLPVSGAVQLEAVTNLTTGTPVVLMRPRASTGCAVATLGVLGVLVALMVLGFLAFALTGST